MQPDTEIKAGDTITITTKEVLGNKDLVSTSYEGLPDDVKVGDMMM